MSIPSVPLRYAGIWSATVAYIQNEMVVSPIDNNAYVLIVPSLIGGSDPSVASADWILIPSGSSGGGVTTLNNKSGEVDLQSNDGLFTFDNSVEQIIYFQRTADSYGIYTEITGGVAQVTVAINGLVSTGIVSICYVHAGGGGGTQYTKSIEPAKDSCTFTFNTPVDVGDQIIWQVLYFGDPV